MTEDVFHCSLCDYNTNKKFNLNRHINIKHKQDEELDINNEEITKICSNVENNYQLKIL